MPDTDLDNVWTDITATPNTPNPLVIYTLVYALVRRKPYDSEFKETLRVYRDPIRANEDLELVNSVSFSSRHDYQIDTIPILGK